MSDFEAGGLLGSPIDTTPVEIPFELGQFDIGIDPYTYEPGELLGGDLAADFGVMGPYADSLFGEPDFTDTAGFDVYSPGFGLQPQETSVWESMWDWVAPQSWGGEAGFFGTTPSVAAAAGQPAPQGQARAAAKDWTPWIMAAGLLLSVWNNAEQRKYQRDLNEEDRRRFDAKFAWEKEKFNRTMAFNQAQGRQAAASARLNPRNVFSRS